ncbi:hypothetical protein AB0H64_39235, partial [Nonomuraea sp. NPDC050733]|uniref:hypothetical protein n=1 Tax=Nonomuraea sp. NPDC050733 TaxID=3154633 RepID=UPI0033C37672
LRRVNDLAVDEEYLSALVDTIVIPALKASSGRAPLPAGIFSGHPAPAAHETAAHETAAPDAKENA